jgi:phage shock protein A
MIFYSLFGIAAFFLIGFASPRSLVGRAVKCLLAFAHIRLSWFEDANAEGLYDYSLEQSKGKLKGSEEKLAKFKAHLDGLNRQLAHAVDVVSKLETKLDALDHLSDIDPAKLTLASQLATWEQRRDDLLSDLADKQSIYNSGRTNLKMATTKIQDEVQQRNFLKADLQAAEAEEGIDELVSGFSQDFMGGELGEAKERLQRRIDEKRAKSQVRRDVSGMSDSIAIEAAVSDAAGADLLARRRATKSAV